MSTTIFDVIRPDLVQKYLSSLAEHLSTQLKVDLAKVTKALETFANVQVTKKEKSELKVAHESGEVAIMLNYGPKSHALFGDTKAIKDTVIKSINDKKSLLRFNKGLEFGSGWVVSDKGRLDELTSALREAKVKYYVITRVLFESNAGDRTHCSESFNGKTLVKNEGEKKKTTKDDDSDEEKPKPKPKAKKSNTKDDDSDNEEEKPKSKSKAKKDDDDDSDEDEEEKPKPKSKSKAKKDDDSDDEEEKPKAKNDKKAKSKAKDETKPLTTQKNKWGNHEDPDTGVIFMTLPVGVGGRSVPVAIGVQDSEAKKDKQGVESVLVLEKDNIKELEETCRVLNKDLANKLKEKDPALYKKLKKFIV